MKFARDVTQTVTSPPMIIFLRNRIAEIEMLRRDLIYIPGYQLQVKNNLQA